MSGPHEDSTHGGGTTEVGLNDLFRFTLELAGLAALGYSGWVLAGGGIGGAALGGTLPAGAAAIWGTFRVDGDPKRAPVPVRGAVRLLIEAMYFAAAAGLLLAAGRGSLGLSLGTAVVVHYAIGYRRIGWLWRHPGRL